ARARTNYAANLIAEGRYTEAETHLRAALVLKPNETEAQASLGIVLAAQRRFDEGIPFLLKAVAARPADPVAHRNLAEAFAGQGRDAEAIPHFLAALEHEPGDVSLLNATAWLLATSADDNARNGARALQLAGRAVELTGGREVVSLDSLAAALAETGRFPEAASTLDRAIRVAESTGQRDILPELHERLGLYRAGQAFRR
ncbi:MAG: tetratricopeptide repeat protein, partial [Acidobacteria bacterium]